MASRVRGAGGEPGLARDVGFGGDVVKLTQVARLLELHADGAPRTHHERYELGGVAHSRMCDLESAGYVFRKWQVKGHDETLFMTQLVAVPPAASRYEVQLERAGAWGAAEAIARMRSAGSPASLHTTNESGPVEVANDGGASELGRPAKALSRSHVERDYECAPTPGAPAGVIPPVAVAPAASSFSGEPVAPPGGVRVLPDELELQLRGIEEELAALTSDVWSLEDGVRFEELERLRDEILSIGRAA